MITSEEENTDPRQCSALPLEHKRRGKAEALVLQAGNICSVTDYVGWNSEIKKEKL